MEREVASIAEAFSQIDLDHTPLTLPDFRFEASHQSRNNDEHKDHPAPITNNNSLTECIPHTFRYRFDPNRTFRQPESSAVIPKIYNSSFNPLSQLSQLPNTNVSCSLKDRKKFSLLPTGSAPSHKRQKTTVRDLDLLDKTSGIETTPPNKEAWTGKRKQLSAASNLKNLQFKEPVIHFDFAAPVSLNPTTSLSSLSRNPLSSTYPYFNPHPQAKKRKSKDLDVLDDEAREAEIDVGDRQTRNHGSENHEANLRSQIIHLTTPQKRPRKKRTPKTITSQELSAKEPNTMSKALQNFQRRFEALSNLSDELLNSGILQPGEILPIVESFPWDQSQIGQAKSTAKVNSDSDSDFNLSKAAVTIKIATTSRSRANQINSYCQEMDLSKKVQGREGYFNLLKTFITDFLSFRACVEVVLRKTSNSLSSQPKENQDVINSNPHSSQDMNWHNDRVKRVKTHIVRPKVQPKAPKKPEFRRDKSDWKRPLELKKIGENPPIHCKEVCETLPYFRAFEGGHYVVNGQTLSYLLDGSPAPRDVFEDGGKVIISHSGGGSKMMSGCGIRKTSEREPSSSQTTNKTRLVFFKSQDRGGPRAQGLLNCLNHRIPVVLLAGKKYAMMPWLKEQEGIGYVVLGYYLVTHCWAEKEVDADFPENICVRIKFRFQWMTSQGEPWWASDMQIYHKGLLRNSIINTPPASTCQSLSEYQMCLGTSLEDLSIEELLTLPYDERAVETDDFMSTRASALQEGPLKRSSFSAQPFESSNNLMSQIREYLDPISPHFSNIPGSPTRIKLCIGDQIIKIVSFLNLLSSPQSAINPNRLSSRTCTTLTLLRLNHSPRTGLAQVQRSERSHWDAVANFTQSYSSLFENLMENQYLSIGARAIYSLLSPSNFNCNGKIQQIQKAERTKISISQLKPVVLMCKLCKTSSPQLYEQGWLCLNESCLNFFAHSTINLSLKNFRDLTYMPWVLLYQPEFEDEERVPQPLQPLSLQSIASGNNIRKLNEDMRRGLYCALCGRMSNRIYWGALRCFNEKCNFEFILSVKHLYKACELPSTYQKQTRTIFKEGSFSSIKEVILPKHQVIIYELPDGSGHIVHAKHRSEYDDGNGTLSELDNLFRSYQEDVDPLAFKRNRFRKGHQFLWDGLHFLENICSILLTINFCHP
ncbi:hypothetical protein CROQUDRAFT_167449 [Cronartium quercuum f. sp. fusiforme G11]|uniref:Uncharacterized protein n=1 Tax=Cronartium quercuum f. sp. fusiforme G11 TaxID=708437 RepID=A0A9P6NGT3_9BASI|nr:hypothetical protein CROQUDRAFT_167449 [Cronartium quercuum f. sp. fusiforme G11]